MLPLTAIVLLHYFVCLFSAFMGERVCLMTEAFCAHDIFLISN